MAEDGITHMNHIITLLRKATLLRYIAEGNVPPDGARPVRARRRAPSRRRAPRPHRV
jgi:hypothetical protein